MSLQGTKVIGQKMGTRRVKSAGRNASEVRSRGVPQRTWRRAPGFEMAVRGKQKVEPNIQLQKGPSEEARGKAASEAGLSR